MHDQGQVLVDDLDAEFGGALGAAGAKRLAVNRDLSCIGRVIAGDAADERRLSRAVVADQPDDLAGPDLEIDILKRMQAAEGLAERG